MANISREVSSSEKIYIKKHFQYHKDGTITRSDRKNSNGSYDGYGYLILKIKGKQYKAHRIAYFLNYGVFPNGEIDHINRNRADNRIENIRVVSRQGNINNTTKEINPDTGVIGVHLTKMKNLKKKYTVKLDGKTYRFYTLDEAIKKRSEHYENRC